MENTETGEASDPCNQLIKEIEEQYECIIYELTRTRDGDLKGSERRGNN
jgi:hypothetical protein